MPAKAKRKAAPKKKKVAKAPSPYRGTGLSDKDFKGGKVPTERWAHDAKYAWDRGVAMSRYLQGFKQGKILGVHCPECDRTMVPPRMFCEWCFRPVDRWVELKQTGIVNTFSLCYVTWDVKRIKEPELPAVIEIDGASPGMGIMHKLGGVDPKKIKIGMKVKAVWKPAAEREGSVTDIKYWKPA